MGNEQGKPADVAPATGGIVKIVIRGDNNTGKSALLRRLQGLDFVPEYEPTPQIQVATIRWAHKIVNEVVKVEVWDVVDHAKRTAAHAKESSLKLSNREEASSEHAANEEDADDLVPALDARWLDVYKGAHGVVFVVDITRPWTFTYAQNEAPKVPPHIPILLLANKRDLYKQQQASFEEMRLWVEVASEHRTAHYAEASMLDGYGLSFLYMYLALPFLRLQRETLLRQLEINDTAAADLKHELTLRQLGVKHTYEAFLEQRRRKSGDPGSANATTVSINSQGAGDELRRESSSLASAAAPGTTKNLTAAIDLDKEVDDFYGDERGLDNPPTAADNDSDHVSAGDRPSVIQSDDDLPDIPPPTASQKRSSQEPAPIDTAASNHEHEPHAKPMESDGLNGEGRVPTSAAITITRAGYASESNSSGLGSDDDGLPMASGRSTEPPAQEQERVRKVSIEAVAESVPVPSFERASSAGTANQSVEDDVSLRIDQSGAEAATSFARHPSSTNRRVSESDKFESFLSDVTDEAPLALSVPLPNVAALDSDDDGPNPLVAPIDDLDLGSGTDSGPENGPEPEAAHMMGADHAMITSFAAPSLLASSYRAPTTAPLFASTSLASIGPSIGSVDSDSDEAPAALADKRREIDDFYGDVVDKLAPEVSRDGYEEFTGGSASAAHPRDRHRKHRHRDRDRDRDARPKDKEKSKRRDNEADGDGRSSREKAHKERSKTKSGGEKKGKEKGDEGRREKRHRDKERERHS